MPARPRSELLELTPVAHGGGAQPLLDFSTGVSPLAPPASVLRAYAAAELARYPHPTAEPLRQAVAAAHGCAPDEVVAGNGSVELIWALARAFVGPGRGALVVEPTFGEYGQAVRASGGRLVSMALEGPPFVLSPGPLLAELREQAPALVFLCRPANPALFVFALEMLEELARAAPDTLFAVDEAYLPLFDDCPAARPRENVCVLRSLTKIFALPGLRLGYLLGDRAVVRAVQSVLPPWNVSAPAQAAGIAALAEPTEPIREEVRRLRQALALRLGAPAAAGGPFLLYRVESAAACSRQLAREGIRVRDCSSFGLPRLIRIGVRSEAEQEKLARAWPLCG